MFPLPISRGKPDLELFRELVEVEVQREDVDTRFAEQAELPTCDVLLNQLPHLVLAEAAGFGNPRSLIERRVGRDVGVKS